MKLQDAADCGKISSEVLPPEMQKYTPAMEDFSISVAGILKLLKNQNLKEQQGQTDSNLFY